MKKFLHSYLIFGTVSLSILIAQTALGSERLTEKQMDSITAGTFAVGVTAEAIAAGEATYTSTSTNTSVKVTESEFAKIEQGSGSGSATAYGTLDAASNVSTGVLVEGERDALVTVQSSTTLKSATSSGTYSTSSGRVDAFAVKLY